MKILKVSVVLLVAVPLLLVVGIFVRNKAVGPAGWAEDNTYKKLKSSLKDPDSMAIRSSFIVQKSSANGDTEIFVCGVVDAIACRLTGC
jgi:hypothetical protein